MEMNLDHSFNSNPFLTTVIGDSNAKSNKWSEDDRSTNEGSKIDFVKELTHILENPSSGFELIFSTQTILVLDSAVHHSLQQDCHHQIIFAKRNLKAYYSPPCERTIFQNS